MRTPQAEVWQRSRLWYQAPSHPLLQQFRGVRTFTSSEPYALAQCSLHQPAMSYLLEHSLQDVAVLPSGLLLEMAWAAGRMLGPDMPTSDSVAVCGASFHHQVVLEFSALAVVTCGVGVGCGFVWLAGQPRIHGDPTLKIVSASLQSVARPGRRAALPADHRYLPSKSGNAASSSGACPLPAAVTVLYMASLLARRTMQATPTNTSSMEVDMHPGHSVPPTAAIACQQLACLTMLSMVLGTAVPAVVGAYMPLAHLSCGRATSASAASTSHGSDQQLLGPSRQVLSVLDSQLKTMTPLAVEPDVDLNALASLGDTFGRMQLHRSVPQPTQQPIATVILETASMLLGKTVDSDQPLMEAGLDSIGVVGLMTPGNGAPIRGNMPWPNCMWHVCRKNPMRPHRTHGDLQEWLSCATLFNLLLAWSFQLLQSLISPPLRVWHSM